MSSCQKWSFAVPARGWGMASIVAALALGMVVMSSAHAQDARQILKSMSDYVTAQKNVSIAFDSDVEVVTSDMQKIQFASSGKALLSRPDKIRVTRTGGYADVELVFDGKTATLFGKNLNSYTQIAAAGTVDQLIDGIRENSKVEVPGADLLLSRLYEELTADVVDAKHIGEGVIDGVECQHLAFRSAELDWQIWIEIGARPIPRKYVITSKHLAGAPQYTLRIKEWNADAPIGEDAFVFKAPADAKQVEVAILIELDEVPLGQAMGGKK
jgi:hypothetical protein